MQQQGWPQKDIAQALGMRDGAVSRWLTRVREHGEAGLTAQPPGVAPRIAAEQLARLPHYWAQGAEHYDLRGDAWPTTRVVVVITREFGVTYHPDHARKRLRQLGWSSQQPIVHTTQRNDQAIHEWVEQRWPLIKKADDKDAR